MTYSRFSLPKARGIDRRADIRAAHRLDDVADIAASGRIAAVGGHGGVGFEEDAWPLAILQASQLVLHGVEMASAEGEEGLRLLLATGRLAEQGEARLQIGQRMGEEVDHHHRDAGRLDARALLVGGLRAEREHGEVGLGRHHLLDRQRTGRARHLGEAVSMAGNFAL